MPPVLQLTTILTSPNNSGSDGDDGAISYRWNCECGAFLITLDLTMNKMFRMTRRLPSRLKLWGKLAVVEASLLILYLKIFGMIGLPLNERGVKLAESKPLNSFKIK